MMKKMLFVVAVSLIAIPTFAQDDGGGGGGAFAGGGGNQVFTRIDAVNPMEPVKAFLQSKANISLSADQEKALRPQVEAAFQQIRDLSDRAQLNGAALKAANDGPEAVASAAAAADVARFLRSCRLARWPAAG